MDDQQEGYSGSQGFPTPPSSAVPAGDVQAPPQPQQAAQVQTSYPQTPQPPVQAGPPMQQVPAQPEAPQLNQPIAGQPPAQGPKSLQKILIGLAVVTLIVAAAGGFYLGASGFINGDTPTPTPTPPPPVQESATTVVATSTPTPPPEVSVEPKLYDSEKFSLSYPGYFSELSIKLDDTGAEIQPRTFEASYLESAVEGSPYTTLLQVVGPEDNSEGFKIKQWLGEKGKLTLEEGLEADLASTTLGGKDASIITGYKSGSNDPGLISAYFILDDGVYSVILKIVEGTPEIGKYQDDFEALLASLSFK